ncbi:MAG TPA: ribonuclease III [Chitinophagaceae bacterium]|nr:ribonuclease III [Chitinophagaceae bacterium]MCC6635766.1 ribonuclease III [Chitinophagaceae bacterium]HMZ47111.1 ribonuclease III [Chitinophagaceae bacterium]HNE93779.1 ribonuclease III [Chitinophagaceae bacterium]HNF29694.1 ribonuclease III [Chitinophagaceae bacterium]
MQFLKNIFNITSKTVFIKQVENVLGFKTHKSNLYITALSHRSIKDTPDQNNERLEYLGDAILSSIVADYLFKRYPYKGEGFLTEMRSKMVNRNQLNDIALKMGLKKITLYNKIDNSLRNSQIFGNTLEAVVGAVYLDKGYKKTQDWVLKQILIPHMFVDDLENIDINLKNKLIGWANKNNKELAFEVAEEKIISGRRLFIINTVIDGEVLSQGSGYNKKDASHTAAQLAIEKLGL